MMLRAADSTSTSQSIHVDLDLVPAVDLGLLVRSLYEGALRFYENPDNMRRFEAWQKEKRRKSDGH